MHTSTSVFPTERTPIIITALSDISNRIMGQILLIQYHALFFFRCGVYKYCCSVYKIDQCRWRMTPPSRRQRYWHSYVTSTLNKDMCKWITTCTWEWNIIHPSVLLLEQYMPPKRNKIGEITLLLYLSLAHIFTPTLSCPLLVSITILDRYGYTALRGWLYPTCTFYVLQGEYVFCLRLFVCE